MISLQNIQKYFHKGSVNEVFALNNINLEIEEGDFITVIGSNGAGKSTLLNCIAGSFFPDSGSITINNSDVTGWPEYKRAKFISRVFQDPLLGTCPSATIMQNMALAVRRGMKRGLAPGVKKKDKVMFREQLAHLGLGLEERLLDTVGLLSGGQRQALLLPTRELAGAVVEAEPLGEGAEATVRHLPGEEAPGQRHRVDRRVGEPLPAVADEGGVEERHVEADVVADDDRVADRAAAPSTDANRKRLSGPAHANAAMHATRAAAPSSCTRLAPSPPRRTDSSCWPSRSAAMATPPRAATQTEPSLATVRSKTRSRLTPPK